MKKKIMFHKVFLNLSPFKSALSQEVKSRKHSGVAAEGWDGTAAAWGPLLKVVNLGHFVIYIKQFMFMKLSYAFLHSNSNCPSVLPQPSWGWIDRDAILTMFTFFFHLLTVAGLLRRGGIQEKR